MRSVQSSGLPYLEGIGMVRDPKEDETAVRGGSRVFCSSSLKSRQTLKSRI